MTSGMATMSAGLHAIPCCWQVLVGLLADIWASKRDRLSFATRMGPP